MSAHRIINMSAPRVVSLKQLPRVFETLPPKYEVELTYSDGTKKICALTAKHIISNYGCILTKSQTNQLKGDEDVSEMDVGRFFLKW